jgi:HTH-type transcriptional regulator / antitoxin HipB
MYNSRNNPVRDYIEVEVMFMNIISTEEIGALVKKVRKATGMTQRQLAATCGVGIRFIIDLESGKPTCELGLALHVLSMLGIKTELKIPTSITNTKKTKP